MLFSYAGGMTSPPASSAMSGLATSMGQMSMGGQPGMMQQQPMGKQNQYFNVTHELSTKTSPDPSLVM